MHKKRERICFSLIINLFFAFTLMVFGPYEIFISNSYDFDFNFMDFWWMLAVVGLLYLVVVTFFLTLLPEKLSDMINIFIFSFTLCCYIQAMFLNGQMKVLIGEQIVWGLRTIIINVVLWCVVFIFAFVLKKIMEQKWKIIIQFFSAALTAMQFIALISLLLTTDIFEEEKYGVISTEGMWELSRDQNVIVFLLDYFDGRTMKSILSENPDALEEFKGFTYFPDMLAVHSRTYPSIPYLLTGEKCYFDKKPRTYVDDAYAGSDFLPALYEKQIDIGLCTSPSYIGSSVKKIMCNYVPAKVSLGFTGTVKYMFKMVLYRDMPYLIKKSFSYDAKDINNSMITKRESTRKVEKCRVCDDEWFAETLEQEHLSLTDAKGSFRFYHFESCHYDLSNPEFYGIRSLEIVNDYLEQMRELGIYEDSTIIIVSDHGNTGGGDTLDLPQGTAVPLLLVKPAGAKDESIKVSTAPVSHSDFIPTVLAGFNLDYSKYGNTVFEVPEGSNRERYFYYSALYSYKIGEVELREYKVDGDANEKENYKFTGNTWDIQYSLYQVAPK